VKHPPASAAFLALLVACLLAPAAPAQRGDAPDARLLPAAEQQALFRLPPGFAIQLVAAEPQIQKPLNVAFDAAGRVWVTGSTLYPWPARSDALGAEIAGFEKNWDDNQLAFRGLASPPPPPEHGLDSVRILSDFDPATGRARKTTVFADGLNIPIGVLPLPRASGARGDSALVYSIPAIWRLTDTDGDGRADVREKLYDGFGFKDTHGMSSSYWLWFDGWVYGTHGFANHSAVTDRAGRTVTLRSGHTYRFRPDGSRFEIFAHGQTNPYGLAFDARGHVYTADSHSKPVYLLLPGGYYEGIGGDNAHDGLGFAPAITQDLHGSSAIAGIAHYSAAAFPPEFQGQLFNGNPVTRRVNRVRLDWSGSTPQAVRQADFLTSDDPSFRPVQVKLGPDGALWIADFYNPIIGHYEFPLTHPARDRTHGRLWRIVWRGLDGSVPVAALPDLAREEPAALAARLADPNLVVRSLVLSELLARADAAIALSGLQAQADALIAGAAPAADETAALPIFFALERLGAGADARLLRALSRPESPAALAALRVLAAREELAPAFAPAIAAMLTDALPELGARLAAELFQRHPQPWQPSLVLSLLERAPSSDTQLVYALRLALKAHALAADTATLQAWAGQNPAFAARLAEVCLAVPTPAAADFLIAHLERTKFSGKRAGDFARHAVRHLPVERFDAVRALQESLRGASAAQRLALAEGLALVAAQPGRVLPETVRLGLRDELLAALGSGEPALVVRAADALKPLPWPEKAAPLRRLALDATATITVRTAALRALAPGAPESPAVFSAVLASDARGALRRVAAQLLGEAPAGAETDAALAAALPTAPADLAVTLAAALVRSEAGAGVLLELARSGRVPPALLRHRYLATTLEKLPAPVQERVAALTRNLPPEDARLDAVIAQRVAAFRTHEPDRSRGATLFAQHCAACHALRGQGGTLGPGLDGVAASELGRVFEDILDPSRNVDPAFRLVTLTLKSGETRSGMNHREEHGRVLLTDPATGRTADFSPGDVTAAVPAPISAMPAVFETLLTEPDLFDLVAYLRTPAAR
jgi:putative membrane-bound dehydrogenase-like protein